MRKNKNLTIIPILAVIMMIALVTASPATAVSLGEGAIKAQGTALPGAPVILGEGAGVIKAQGTVQGVDYGNGTLRLNNQTYVFDEDRTVVFLRGKDVAVSDVVVMFYKEEEAMVDGKPTVVRKGLRLIVYARGAAAKGKAEGDDQGVSRSVDIVY
jgi:hypothetical protein